MKYIFSSVTSLMISLSPLSVLGNFVGNDTSNFNPTTNGLSFVTVHGSTTLPAGSYYLGGFVNEATNSLPMSEDSLGTQFNPDDRLLMGDLTAVFALGSRFDLGINFSYLISQIVTENAPGAQFAANGLNSINFNGKYHVGQKDHFGFAVVTSLNMNQTRSNPFVGNNGGPSINIEGVVDYKVAHYIAAFNVGYRFRNKGSELTNSVYDPIPDQVIASAAFAYRFPTTRSSIITELNASQLTEDTQYVSKERISSEALVGYKYTSRQHYNFHLGAGTKVSEGLFTPDLRVYAGITTYLGLPEDSRYQVKDESTKVAMGAASTQAPSYPIENQSMNLPAETVELADKDTYTPQDINALRDINFDRLTKKHEFKLRTDLGEDLLKSNKPPFEVLRLQNFDFDFGSSVIKPEHYPQLDRVTDYLDGAPPILKIRVEGHTDSVGSNERNKRRSQERADNVRKHLERSGKFTNVKIESVGFGAERPVADNSLPEGRKENRRVEIRVLRALK